MTVNYIKITAQNVSLSQTEIKEPSNTVIVCIDSAAGSHSKYHSEETLYHELYECVNYTVW